MLQRTIKHSVHCFGKGLHCGESVSMSIHPAAENTGIVFVRSDIVGEQAKVKASYENVCATQLGTTIANEYGTKISTIEHLMAAFWGFKISNAIVEINNSEVPVMDGSSEPFIFLLECAGIDQQTLPVSVVKVLKKVEVSDNMAKISVSPNDHFSVQLSISFKSDAIAKQSCIFDETQHSFKMDLCRARTFGFYEEVEHLKSIGLAKGGSLENAVVIKDNAIMNAEGLRCDDEFVRHKVLDCVGDVYLGGIIQGSIIGECSGHTTNNKLLRALFADKDAWTI